MSVVAVVSQKGGVGKSTLCIHIATEAVRKKLRAVIIELDRQGTTSLFWSKRRAKALQPDDMVGRIDDNPPQPVVHRVDPSTLMPVLEQMRLAGIEYVVLDLPGAHNPGVNMAMQASDYVLVPTRPHDVDLHSSLETADAARRLKKPSAFVLTLVPSTGKDAEETRDALEEQGFVVAPFVLGDRRKDYADAVASGLTVQEMAPQSKSATEIRELYKWLRKELEKVHGRNKA
jgi:chromosome partitioning protein